MKRILLIIICLLVIVTVAVVIIHFYLTHRTHYLNYNYEKYAGQKISYIGVGVGIKLKTNSNQAYFSEAYGERSYPNRAYPAQTIVTDKLVIKKIIDYLNRMPLVISTDKAAYNNNKDNRMDAIIRFYDEDDNETGWISFRGEKYLRRSLDGKVFKARDEGILIVSGLEELDLN